MAAHSARPFNIEGCSADFATLCAHRRLRMLQAESVAAYVDAQLASEGEVKPFPIDAWISVDYSEVIAPSQKMQQRTLRGEGAALARREADLNKAATPSSSAGGTNPLAPGSRSSSQGATSSDSSESAASQGQDPARRQKWRGWRSWRLVLPRLHRRRRAAVAFAQVVPAS